MEEKEEEIQPWRLLGIQHNGGGDMRRKTPREQPPASSRALMPAPDLTNPRGPGSPLHRVLGEGPWDYTHHNDVDGWLRPPKH